MEKNDIDNNRSIRIAYLTIISLNFLSIKKHMNVNRFSSILLTVSKSIDFLRNDVWFVSLNELSPVKSLFVKIVRIIILSSYEFKKNNCRLRASALTFYSLLSIVPIVALAFGIAKGFGSEKIFEKQLIEKFPGQEDVVIEVIGFAYTLLDETKGGMIAGVGVVLLFWAVIKLLGNIEHSFNKIWEIKNNRSFGRKVSDYLSIMLICPILVISSSSVTVFINSEITNITQRYEFLGVFNPFIFFLFNLLPYCVIWGVFAFTYIFLPNTKVSLKAGIITGIIAGTTYQFAQLAYISFQVYVSQYNTIYGSFAALPLFLIWLQLSWLIVLFGAGVAYTLQNIDQYEFTLDCSKLSLYLRKRVSLLIAHAVIINFSKGNKPVSAIDISDNTKVPVRLVKKVIYELVECGIISETMDRKKRDFAYQPACDINILTVKFIIDALEKNGVKEIPFIRTSEINKVSGVLKSMDKLIEESSTNVLLKSI